MPQVRPDLSEELDGPDSGARTAVNLQSAAEAGDAAPVASPARALQATLNDQFAAQSPDQRWSRRGTTLFVVGYCSVFWIALAYGLSAFF